MLPSKSNWSCISSKDLGLKMLPVSPPLGLLSHIRFCTPPTSAPQMTLTCKVTRNAKMRMRQLLPAGAYSPAHRVFPWNQTLTAQFRCLLSLTPSDRRPAWDGRVERNSALLLNLIIVRIRAWNQQHDKTPKIQQTKVEPKRLLWWQTSDPLRPLLQDSRESILWFNYASHPCRFWHAF